MLNSVWARVEIGLNSIGMIAEAPIVGHGIGSFNYEYPRFQEAYLQWFDRPSFMPLAVIDVGHAHNEVLQVLVEYGAVGLAIMGVFLWFVVRRALVTKDPIGRAAVVSLWIAAMLSLIEFPLHNPATGLLMALAAGIIVQSDRWKILMVPKVGRWGLVAASLAFCAIMLGTGTMAYASHVYYSRMRVTIGQAPVFALNENLKAYEAWPFDRGPRRQLMLTIAKVLRERETRLSPDAADRAYEITVSAARNNQDVRMLRAEYLLNSGRWIKRNDEIVKLIAGLVKTAKRQPGTWIIVASYALKRGDSATAAYAIKEGRRYASDEIRPQFNTLENLLKEGGK